MVVLTNMYINSIEKPISTLIKENSLKGISDKVAASVDEFIDLVGFHSNGFVKICFSNGDFYVFNVDTKDFIMVRYET